MSYKIYIEVPDNWFDIESPTGWGAMRTRDIVHEKIKEEVVKQFISKVELPEITIPQSELREAIKERMVDEIMKKNL